MPVASTIYAQVFTIMNLIILGDFNATACYSHWQALATAKHSSWVLQLLRATHRLFASRKTETETKSELKETIFRFYIPSKDCYSFKGDFFEEENKTEFIAIVQWA